jgi:hypothetical protein
VTSTAPKFAYGASLLTGQRLLLLLIAILPRRVQHSPSMRPLRLLLALSSGFIAVTLLLYVILVPSQDEQFRKQSNTRKHGGFKALLSFTSPGSLFPPSAIISLTDDNSTFFLARPAAFGPTLPADGLSSALWVGSGFGDDSLGKGELGCGDSLDWARHEARLTHEPASATRDSSKETPSEGSMDDDIQSLQESAEIDGKVVLLKRGQCGFLAKVLWAQRRGAVAVIVGDNVRGGALIRMYAQDDTSNVTIPSIFTSHTTAHLLSSLLPVDGSQNILSETSGSRRNLSPGGEECSQTPKDSGEQTAWWAKWFGASTANASLHKIKTSSGRSAPHKGLWVTLTPTNVSTSPFFDTLLVLVVSPLVTLTVVYALLLLRSRIRRRRWRAPKSLVERLPVRTYQTISDSITSATPSATSPRTPLLHHSSAENSSPTPSSHSVSDDEEPATSSANRETNRVREEEKRETGLAEWRRRYGGRQKECVVCLDEYVDGVSQVMSLPCGHEFHADCMSVFHFTVHLHT